MGDYARVLLEQKSKDSHRKSGRKQSKSLLSSGKLSA